MSLLLDIVTVVLVVFGALFFIAGSVGLLRFPDVHTRLHAMTKADNLGLGLIVLGLMPQAGGWLPAFKLLFIWILALVAAATVTQLIARHAMLHPNDKQERRS